MCEGEGGLLDAGGGCVCVCVSKFVVCEWGSPKVLGRCVGLGWVCVWGCGWVGGWGSFSLCSTHYKHYECSVQFGHKVDWVSFGKMLFNSWKLKLSKFGNIFQWVGNTQLIPLWEWIWHHFVLCSKGRVKNGNEHTRVFSQNFWWGTCFRGQIFQSRSGTESDEGGLWKIVCWGQKLHQILVFQA